MPYYAIVFGGLLVALGLQGFYDFNGWLGVETGAKTALIPAYFGAALVALGLISLAAPGARKHAMHVAAMVGLLGAIGGAFRPVKAQMAGTLDLENAPTKLQLAMVVLCVCFVALCVNSFIAARRARKAAAAP